jgi:hypothetical protein
VKLPKFNACPNAMPEHKSQMEMLTSARDRMNSFKGYPFRMVKKIAVTN